MDFADGLAPTPSPSGQRRWWATARPTRRVKKKKPLTIDGCLGYAIGAVGMSYGDFSNLTPKQFGEVWKAYNEASERDYRNG